MTLSDQEMLDVMAYADDELEDARLADVKALLDKSAEAREVVASMQAIGEGVRTALKLGSKIDVTANVMAALVPNDLDRARLARQSRTRTVAVLATAFALAAGAWFYSRGDAPTESTAATPPLPTQQPAPVLTAVQTSVAALNPAPALAANHTVQVDSVDTHKPVSVFYVDNATGPSSVVVWIDDPVVGN